MKEQRLFPQDKLFWNLIDKERRMVEFGLLNSGERLFFLRAYKWGWQDANKEA